MSPRTGTISATDPERIIRQCLILVYLQKSPIEALYNYSSHEERFGAFIVSIIIACYQSTKPLSGA